MIVFLLAHIPLIYWILQGVRLGNEEIYYWFDIFLVIHFVLHIFLLKDKKNEFNDWVSWTIILGAAICRFVDLMIK